MKAKAPPSYRICLPPKLTNNIWEMSVVPPRQMAETKGRGKEGETNGEDQLAIRQYNSAGSNHSPSITPDLEEGSDFLSD